MTALPPSYSLTDSNEWHADVLPQIDAKLRSCIYDSEWLSDAPSPFDVQHQETARLYETNSGVSPTILGQFDPEQPRKSIPPDRTVLGLFEKRAVIVSGEVARLWPLRYETALDPRDGGYFAITEGSIFSHLRVQLFSSIGGAVGQATVMSARMGGSPVIVARLLSSTDWY
ncbi:hypothetical protein E3T61_04105 [Cryobacterium lactosi]|uniref:Uncharacterized protein n=1 Tax=Cryobacterium lactosi TaxID=1259202 RepID=A0A4R9BXW2_9MICO|nr:hypothetical protein [Cryobacterium lactosi]TFD93291.1 hypothetical protein E3T61_04105 [Cryobacterium lactosi]